MAFTRAEIEDAFQRFQETAERSAKKGEWSEWVNSSFTEDAKYYEHHYGHMQGRTEILQWINATMAEWPNSEMRSFPVDWYVIDEEKGWVIAQVWNRMVDPGDGSLHQAYNFTLLKYAGNLKWSYEEDIYNPAHFKDMTRGYLDRKKKLAEGS